MKKILAVLMSLVMLFSLAVMPVSAAQEEEKKEITVAEVFETIETTAELIKDTLVQVHFLVGTILGLLEKECPMCGEMHEVNLEDETVEGEDEVTELPELPEAEDAESGIVTF